MADPAPAAPFTSILVPLDGSPLAEAALPPAVALAGKLGARVTLLHVLEADAPATVRPFLQRGAEDLPHDPGRAVDAVARSSDADDGHARDRSRRWVPDDERDVVARVGEALALPVEDPVVTEGVDRSQVPHPHRPARPLVRH